MILLFLFLLPFLTVRTALILAAFLLLLVYFYRSVRKAQSYWKEKGVKYVDPRFLVGNVQIFKTRSFTEAIQDLYRHYPEERYHGIYQFLKPSLLIKDPDLIKLIGVKEFDSFLDHRNLVSPGVDPIWDRNLFAANGEKWREMRTILSPSFTSSKMKIMFGLIKECAQEFVKYFENEIGTDQILELEMKETFTRYTNDVVASTAFGLKCNSFVNKDNDFYSMGKKMTNLKGLATLKFFIVLISPTLSKILNIKLISDETGEYFSKIIKDTVETREKQGIVRPDMIHLLMEAKKGSNQDESGETKILGARKRDITMDDIISQAMIFFIAGFDTVSTVLSFTFYELAVNPEVQNKLRSEINQNTEQITYESLLGMKYLDMVLSESLRRWSPNIITDRKVTKPFTIPAVKPGERPLHLEEGIICVFPICALHNDPKYFPNPEKFDPERFNDENRKRINPAVYMPFGIGPRNCIGSRFAMLEMKMLLYYVIREFEVCPVAKTNIPMVLEKELFLRPKGGMWLGFKKIKS